MNEDLLQRAKDVLWAIETYGCDIADAETIINLLVNEIKRLAELTDWQSENNKKWKQTNEELSDEIKQWIGRYEEMKARLVVKDIKIQELQNWIKDHPTNAV